MGILLFGVATSTIGLAVYLAVGDCRMRAGPPGRRKLPSAG